MTHPWRWYLAATCWRISRWFEWWDYKFRELTVYFYPRWRE